MAGTIDSLLKDLKSWGIGITPLEVRLLDVESDGRTVPLECHRMVIRLKDEPNTPKGIGCLSHEVFHAVDFLFDKIGIKIMDDCANEAHAYLIGFLVTQALERYNQGRPKNKNN